MYVFQHIYYSIYTSTYIGPYQEWNEFFIKSIQILQSRKKHYIKYYIYNHNTGCNLIHSRDIQESKKCWVQRKHIGCRVACSALVSYTWCVVPPLLWLQNHFFLCPQSKILAEENLVTTRACLQMVTYGWVRLFMFLYPYGQVSFRLTDVSCACVTWAIIIIHKWHWPTGAWEFCK